jgi:hypothetical protein
VTRKHRAPKAELREKFEAPLAIRLDDSDRTYGGCNSDSMAKGHCSSGGSVAPVGYRVHDYTGACVTGKAATDGCYAGVGCNAGSGG